MIIKSRSLMFLSIITAIAVGIAFPTNTRADVITEWNLTGLQAGIAAGRPGASMTIDLATMHAAMYDAVQALEKDYEPYRVSDVPSASGSPLAAAAKAARDVLAYRFPSQVDTFDNKLSTFLTANGLNGDPGLAVGAYVAAKLLAYRSCDGSLPIPTATFMGGTGIGQWRPTPTANSAMNPGEYYGQITPFFMTRPTQFRSEPPPPVNSKRYSRDYEEVKLYGAKNGSLRSGDQTNLALFWAGNSIAAVYSGVRNLADAHVNNVSDSSRLFALVAMSQADATIGVWDDKFHYNYWRPMTAIQNGDNDGNDDTVGNISWESLILNPPYPDYSSGANGISGSTMQSLENFFETDRMEFDMSTTNTATGTPIRHFTSFSQAMQEVVDGRVLLGIHFRFADEAARKLGQDVAKWGHKNYLRPRKGSGN
jgi:hypothetical protein